MTHPIRAPILSPLHLKVTLGRENAQVHGRITIPGKGNQECRAEEEHHDTKHRSSSLHHPADHRNWEGIHTGNTSSINMYRRTTVCLLVLHSPFLLHCFALGLRAPHAPKKRCWSETSANIALKIFSSTSIPPHLSFGATGWNIWQLSEILTPGRYVLSAITIASVLS